MVRSVVGATDIRAEKHERISIISAEILDELLCGETENTEQIAVAQESYISPNKT
jgi:chorismate mutase